LTPMSCSAIASSPAVTCSPEATTASYSRASCSGEASRHQATSSLVLPAMAETTTATSWPASTSRLTWRATLRMRSISATDVPPNFITRRMVKPSGFMVVATLNRTLKSFALAIVGAEYVLGWLPRGTHRWEKFVTPDELEIALERVGFEMRRGKGVVYNLFADRWQIASDMDVNYMVMAERMG
jgi:ubiquinone biosynthesis O-methyltransferase